MPPLVRQVLLPLGSALCIAPVSSEACETGRTVYDQVTDAQPQIEPAIQITHFQVNNPRNQSLTSIRAWPEIVGIAPLTSVEIE